MSYTGIIRAGVWDNNVVLVQLIGLCPTLAVTNSATNGLGMGLATVLVLALSNLCVSALRRVVRQEVRVPIYVLIIATLVTVLDALMNVWLPDLHKVLGIFIPLIVVNCSVLGRAEAFASRAPAGAALLDGIATGVGFALALVVLGGVRELIAGGALFGHASLLLGEAFRFLEVKPLPIDRGMLLAILPPGGFIVLGTMVAAANAINARRAAAAAAAAAGNPATAG